jgi:outer membrane protein OmpA-like peptidoglycan-associated protein
MKIGNRAAWFAIVAFATIGAPLHAKDIPGSKDHPLLKRFEGSEIVRYKAAPYATLDFYNKDKSKVSPEGQMVRILFRVPAGKSSSLEVFRNYENELKEKGWDLGNSGPSELNGFGINDLITQQKLPADFGSLLGLGNPYYIYAVRHDPAGDVHLDVIIAQFGPQDSGSRIFKGDDVVVSVDSIQAKPLSNKMVDGTASDMAKEIASAGRVNLYGIYFDTDKTDIKPASKATLDEVAKLLNGEPTLKLQVVGHTDNKGTAEYNNNLSMRRAQAVVKELTTAYKIAADRLQPSGKGFSEPVAPNDTEAGRAKNRRVELVKM